MAENNDQSTDEATETASAETNSEEATSGLEEVYNEYNIEETANEFQQRTRPTAAQPQAPTNQPNEYYYREEDNSEIMRTLNTVQTQLTALHQQRERERIEQDIGEAVKYVSGKVEGVKPSIVDVMLNAEAQDDPRFLRLWENRQKNPVAWKKGLDAMAKKIQDQFVVKQDPQLTENQRAARQSQRSMNSPSQPRTDGWEELSPREFSAKWNSLLSGD